MEYDKQSSNTPTYAYYSTKLSLDEAKAAFERVKELSIQLSMIENAAIRLATNIKKTQKRANALKNITIQDMKLSPEISLMPWRKKSEKSLHV